MTSPALSSIQKLRHVAAALEEGRAPDAGDAAWLANGFKKYLGSAEFGATLDVCLGVAAMTGETGWWTVGGIEARDAALCELAARFYPAHKVAAQAREIEREAWRYAAATWRFDGEQAGMPERYTGTRREWLWLAFKSGAAMPLKQRRLEAILAAQKRPDAA